MTFKRFANVLTIIREIKDNRPIYNYKLNELD